MAAKRAKNRRRVSVKKFDSLRNTNVSKYQFKSMRIMFAESKDVVYEGLTIFLRTIINH